MSKTQYVNAMSGIRPSEQTVERMMKMAKPKRKFRMRKGLLLAMIVAIVLAFGGVTANAATDGAVKKAIDEGINNVRVIIDGKEVNNSDYKVDKNSFAGDNGEKIDEYVVDMGNGQGFSCQIASDEEGVEWSVTANTIDGEVSISTDSFTEPTTVAN